MNKLKYIKFALFALIYIFMYTHSANAQNIFNQLNQKKPSDYVVLRAELLKDQEFVKKLTEEYEKDKNNWLVNSLYIRKEYPKLAKKVDKFVDLIINPEVFTDSQYKEAWSSISLNSKFIDNNVKELKNSFGELNTVNLNNVYIAVNAREVSYNKTYSNLSFQITSMYEAYVIPSFSENTEFLKFHYLLAENIYKCQEGINTPAFLLSTLLLAPPISVKNNKMLIQADYSSKEGIESTDNYVKAFTPLYSDFLRDTDSPDKFVAALTWSAVYDKDNSITQEAFIQALKSDNTFVRSNAFALFPVSQKMWDNDENYRQKIQNALIEWWKIEKKTDPLRALYLFRISKGARYNRLMEYIIKNSKNPEIINYAKMIIKRNNEKHSDRLKALENKNNKKIISKKKEDVPKSNKMENTNNSSGAKKPSKNLKNSKMNSDIKKIRGKNIYAIILITICVLILLGIIFLLMLKRKTKNLI